MLPSPRQSRPIRLPPHRRPGHRRHQTLRIHLWCRPIRRPIPQRPQGKAVIFQLFLHVNQFGESNCLYGGGVYLGATDGVGVAGWVFDSGGHDDPGAVFFRPGDQAVSALADCGVLAE